MPAKKIYFSTALPGVLLALVLLVIFSWQPQEMDNANIQEKMISIDIKNVEDAKKYLVQELKEINFEISEDKLSQIPTDDTWLKGR